MKATLDRVDTCCEHILREEEWATGLTPIRCAALATPGSRYCPVHAALWAAGPRAVAPRPKAPPRNLDADVLPWTRTDKRLFAEAVEREAAKRKRGSR